MASHPISLSPTRASLDSVTLTHRASTTSTPYSTCAYPSWPSGCGFKAASTGVPSAYVSDEDLFGDDDEPYLSEPPPPPRPAEMWAPVMLARPLLPPVTKTRRRSSGQKKERKGSSKATSSAKV